MRYLHKLRTRTLLIILALVTAISAASIIPSVSTAARGYSNQLAKAARSVIATSNTAKPLSITTLEAKLAEPQQGETLATATGSIPRQNAPLAVIYDTTRASNQGAEITAAANGAATSMGDLIVLGGTNRFITQIDIDLFTLASTTPFSLTMSLYTDCSTDGSSNSPCGNGVGTLIPGSTVTVNNITPPALGTIFTVSFPYPLVNVSSEADNTISVVVNASRSDVFWRIGETPTVGSQPDGGTSFVTRCGSTAANNGCSRNFGVTNNFAITISADPTGGCTFNCPQPIVVNNDPNQCSAVVNYTPPTGTNCTITCLPAPGTAFAVGTTTVTCTNTGGTPSCTFTVTVNDATPPTITCPTDQSVVGSGPTVVNYPAPTASDNCPGVSVSCVPASGSSFPVGTTTVTCTASDATAQQNGQPQGTAQCSFTVTVIPCTITCPTDQVAWTSGTSAPVNYPAPTTTGNCGTVTCSPASGSTFNVGTTTVTCSTTAGPSCSFNLTVNQLTLGAALADPIACTGPGNKVNGSFSATNNSGASATVSVSATLSNIAYLPNTATATQSGSIIV
ncbi:MAG: HYR domain-containing protein, partial [Acidobacteriota bacterium]|nr:HYR domain-containing protein [Acidobacteriota bacterium]